MQKIGPLGKHDRHHRHFRLPQVQAADAEIVAELAIHLLEPIAPIHGLARRMADEIMGRRGDFEFPAELRLKLGLHFEGRVGSEIRSRLAVVRGVGGSEIPQPAVASQQPDFFVRPGERRPFEMPAANRGFDHEPRRGVGRRAFIADGDARQEMPAQSNSRSAGGASVSG